jgi:hypothetical protein
MALGADDLLPGEVVRLSRSANALVGIDEVGLSRFAFDHLMWVVGAQGKEAIGGRLHVTNYRLVFTAHPINRLRGRFSIFLPVVTGVRATSSGVRRQVEIATTTQRFTFVVWGVPTVIAAVDRARTELAADRVESLARAAVADYAKVGGGLRIVRGIEAANVTLRTAMRVSKVVRSAITPDLNQIELTGALGLVELLDQLDRDGD